MLGGPQQRGNLQHQRKGKCEPQDLKNLRATKEERFEQGGEKGKKDRSSKRVYRRRKSGREEREKKGKQKAMQDQNWTRVV